MSAAVFFRTVEAGDVFALRKLFASDAATIDVNMKDENGCSPLFHARDSDTATFLLIERKADVNARNSAGETPLFYAVRGATSTHIAELLLDNGADGNARNERQETALYDASSIGMVRLLIQRGAIVCALNKFNHIPLFNVVRFNYVDAAEELINAGSNVQHLDVFGQTAMFDFTLSVTMLQLLVRYGASVHTVSKNGETAVHQAAIYGNLDAIRFLFDHGAAIDVATNTNITPLYETASRGRLEAALYLLDKSARVHGDPSFDKLPVLVAARNGHLTVVAELLARGASFTPEMSHDSQRNPMSSSHSALLSHVQVLDLMIEHCGRVMPLFVSSASFILTTWMGLLEKDLNKAARKLESLWEPIVAKLNALLAVMKNNTHASLKRNYMTNDDECECKTSIPTLMRFGETVLRLWRWTLEYATRKPSVEQIFYSNLLTPEDMDTMLLLREMVEEFQVTGNSIMLIVKENLDETSWQRLVFTCSRPLALLRATKGEPEKLRAFILDNIRDDGNDDSEKHNDTSHRVWDALHTAAVGLAALHKRGFVHGELAPKELSDSDNDSGDDNQVTTQISTLKPETEPTKSEATRSTPPAIESKKESEAVRWRSPELLKDEGASAFYASDVYAFGMCTVEAISGERPWGKVSSGVVCVLVGLGRLPRRPECFSDEQWALIEAMCARDQTKRPEMTFVAQKLQLIVKQEQGKGQS